MAYRTDYKRCLIGGVSLELRLILRNHLEWERTMGVLNWNDAQDIDDIPDELRYEYESIYDMARNADGEGFDDILVLDGEEDVPNSKDSD